MSIFASGIQVNVSQDSMVKLDFIDAADNMNMTKVASIVMTLECFRNLRDGAANIIEQHENKLKQVAKAN